MAETIVKPTDSLNVIWSGEHLERYLVDGVTYKWCTYENHWVDEENFGINRARSDNKDRYCKECSRQDKAIKKKHAKIKDMLFEKQNYQCMICLEPITKKRYIHVDHCHETGIVRGVLCHHCNNGLGGFKDNIQNIVRSLPYLHKNGEMPYLWEKAEKLSFFLKVTKMLYREIYFDKVEEID